MPADGARDRSSRRRSRLPRPLTQAGSAAPRVVGQRRALSGRMAARPVTSQADAATTEQRRWRMGQVIGDLLPLAVGVAISPSRSSRSS